MKYRVVHNYPNGFMVQVRNIFRWFDFYYSDGESDYALICDTLEGAFSEIKLLKIVGKPISKKYIKNYKKIIATKLSDDILKKIEDIYDV